ncbi:unnamed protein product [Chironomus riparius]|uniref:Uncharacterized protein n=1 Tax=Chironomus riparius TaxID=315576 RepID=A0A9N9RG36_9DIPT|nr:unnamed protein product [Chironomus riparius]
MSKKFTKKISRAKNVVKKKLKEDLRQQKKSSKVNKVLYRIGFLVVFTSVIYLSTSINLVCEFKEQILWPNEKFYGCELSNMANISAPELVNISSATGTHQNGKTNNHVNLFFAERKGIDYFPQGLDKIFPNLNAMVVKKNKMKEIRASDLRSYWKLIYLSLSSNLIEVLEDGTFDHNTELKYLLFASDKLIHVGLNVFNNLIKLNSISFIENICINSNAVHDVSKVQEVVKNAKTQCRDYEFLKLDGKIKSMESDSQHLNHENLIAFEQNLDNLEFEIKNSRFSFITSLKLRIKELQDKKSEFKLSLNGNFENIKRTDGVQVLDDKLKINIYESFEKIEKDLEGSHMYILKAVDMKMKEFETRLMEKLQEVLLQNVNLILKGMENGDKGSDSKVTDSKV